MKSVEDKLMKLNESLERMWDIFFSRCKDSPVVTDYLHEKEKCHNLMAEISGGANKIADHDRRTEVRDANIKDPCDKLSIASGYEIKP